MSGIIYCLVGARDHLTNKELLVTLGVTDSAGSQHSLNTVPILDGNLLRDLKLLLLWQAITASTLKNVTSELGLKNFSWAESGHFFSIIG